MLSQLHHGADTPPLAAGADSGVNHPGVISGVHTHSLDRSSFNQWVIDDASGQLRMRLLVGHADSELGLGHLIQQRAGSAQRGSWRGAGFEALTRGWVTVHAAGNLHHDRAETRGKPGLPLIFVFHTQRHRAELERGTYLNHFHCVPTAAPCGGGSP